MTSKLIFKYVLKSLLISLFISTLVSCNWVMATSDHLEIVVKGDSFTISWEDDSLRIANDVNKTVKYKIFYRTHGSSFWMFLDETPADKYPEFRIDNTIIDYGKYDLGVSSVNSQGRESTIHSSLDMTADPFCGWYVNWIGTK